MYMCMYAGLEKGGFASPSVNHLWGNCESLWQTDSPYFWVAANHFWPMANYFSNGFTKKSFFIFLVLNPLLEKFYT